MDFKKLYQEIGFGDGIYHFSEEENYHIIISLANEYSSLPDLGEIEGLKKVSDEIRHEYFESLHDDDMRITLLNGISTEECYPCIACDYCRQLIGSLRYYCRDCWKDMCVICYSERSEEDALKNGAKNYHLRKESLQKCQKEHELKWMCDSSAMICDVCSKEIKENVLKETSFATNSDLKDDYQRQDVCSECLDTIKGQEFVKENKLTTRKVKIRYNCDQSGFGSMLDWVPIYQSRDEYNFVFYNINKSSPHYSTLSCSAEDDHGRMGYYQLPEPYSKLGDSFKSLIAKQIKANLQVKDESESGWEIYYNGVLQLAMDEMGMQVHYG